jgi:hypothetical protein
MKLTGDNVHSIFMNCLYESGENTDNHVLAEGVIQKVGFHPGRLQQHKIEILEMLASLPDSFKKTGGGGMSFLNMCEDGLGNQWTSLHQRMDELVCLGSAIGSVSFAIPREYWSTLPGGMPYITVE